MSWPPHDTHIITNNSRCCIDKRSSSELSEAINSMYKWYRNSAVCYAFLGDVDPPSRLRVNRDQFKNSRWFTRGWTLQELLAPLDLRFYSHDWSLLGDREKLADLVTEVTGIERRFVLYGPTGASAAKKMSWAALRKTTRTEDIAYCLMGLFGINMPLLYGEAEKAFIRLQQEVARATGDHSIFAWGKPFNLERFLHPPPKPRRTIKPARNPHIELPQMTTREADEAAAKIPIARDERKFGLFAESPRYFEHCGNVDSVFECERMDTPLVVYGKSVRIGLPVLSGVFTARDMERIPWLEFATVALLSCQVEGEDVALVLRPAVRDPRCHMRSRNPIIVHFTNEMVGGRTLQECMRMLIIKDMDSIEVHPAQ